MASFIKKITFIYILVLLIILSNNGRVLGLDEGHVQDCYRCNTIRFNKTSKITNEIKELQHWLKIYGFYAGKIDGLYGMQTLKGIKSFQRARGIKADGIIGKNTWNQIGNYKAAAISTKESRLPKGNSKLFVNLLQKKLVLIKNGHAYKDYKVAIGRLETPTPIGRWVIKRKAENWGTGFGSRWMGLNINWGLYGIHGTNKPWSIGRSASHGCIRMNNKDVEDLYQYVHPGDKVNVYGNPFGHISEPLRVLMKGEKGTDVVEIQKQLTRLGYYKKRIDGIFGSDFEKSVKELQKDMKVEVTAQIREREYKFLGFGDVTKVRERKRR